MEVWIGIVRWRREIQYVVETVEKEKATTVKNERSGWRRDFRVCRHQNVKSGITVLSAVQLGDLSVSTDAGISHCHCPF